MSTKANEPSSNATPEPLYGWHKCVGHGATLDLDSVLRFVKNEVFYEEGPRLGLMLYGSLTLECADDASDLDLMDIRASIEKSHEVLFGTQGLIDLTRITEAALLARFKTQYPGNNNLYLNAALQARILLDPTGALRKLKRQATDIHQAGPPLLSPTTRKQKAEGLRKHWMTLGAYAERASHSADAACLFEMRTGVFLKHAIKFRYELLGEWASSLRHLVTQSRICRPEVLAL